MPQQQVRVAQSAARICVSRGDAENNRAISRAACKRVSVEKIRPSLSIDLLRNFYLRQVHRCPGYATSPNGCNSTWAGGHDRDWQLT